MNEPQINSANLNDPLSDANNSFDFDVIVIGAGPAGLSAALWCDELQLETLVLEAKPEIGGQLLWVYNPIENHLGTLRTANGQELRDLFAQQIAQRNFKLKTDASIAQIDLQARKVFLASGETLRARSLILATGVRRQKLNVPGEAEFQNRGILESGKRDAQLVAGKTVCVVGGGDAALENALILAETAKKVYLVHRRGEFRARREFVDKIQTNSRIEVLRETKVSRILGDTQIRAVALKKNESTEIFELAVDAVLLRIGVTPNTEFFGNQLKLASKGYVQIDAFGQTNLENVFAVGDVANQLAPTVSSAVGMGAIAAKVIANNFQSK